MCLYGHPSLFLHVAQVRAGEIYTLQHATDKAKGVWNAGGKSLCQFFWHRLLLERISQSGIIMSNNVIIPTRDLGVYRRLIFFEAKNIHFIVLVGNRANPRGWKPRIKEDDSSWSAESRVPPHLRKRLSFATRQHVPAEHHQRSCFVCC